jgi:hypothetical protein
VGRVLPDPTGQYGRIRVAGSIGFIATSLFFQITGLISGDSALSILTSFTATVVLAAGTIAFLPRVPHLTRVPQAARAVVSRTPASGIGVPNFIASSVADFLLEARGFSTLFLVYAAVTILGILILAAFGKRLLPRKGFDIS